MRSLHSINPPTADSITAAERGCRGSSTATPPGSQNSGAHAWTRQRRGALSTSHVASSTDLRSHSSDGESGLVRQCHGDLHLRNIVLLDGRPTWFDGVEFNDEIACTDVLYGLAFLLLDLRRQLPRHANAVLNGYLAETEDLAGISLLPLFLSCRAAVRAKTPPQRSFSRTQCDATSFTASSISRWPNNSSIRHALLSSPSEGSQARVSRHWRWVSHRSSAPCLVRWCCGATRTRVRHLGRACVSHRSQRMRRRRSSDCDLMRPNHCFVARAGQRRGDASDADADVVRIQRALGPGEISWRRLDASGSAAAVLATATDYVRNSS